jgi:predicted secreted protein
MPGGTELSRRRFIGLAAIAAGLMAEPGMRQAGSEPPPTFEDLHRPRLHVPALTSNGARVPMVVEVPHPMLSEHRITGLQVVNPRDPVPVKGTFEFSPANGRAYVAFQARLDEGPSTVTAIADCSRHGRVAATAAVTIAEGAGGCAGGAPPTARMAPDDIIDVQVKTKHPNRTGLVLRDGRFVQESEPFHLNEMVVFYGSEQVSRFVLSAALSDNPLITFKLRARRQAPIRVTLANTRGQRFEATHELHWS